jgi:nitrate reductase (NAD(P)H)
MHPRGGNAGDCRLHQADGREASAKDKAQSAQQQSEDGRLALQKHHWVPVKVLNRRAVSEDTRTNTFELPPGKPELGLGTCQHIQVGFQLKEKMLVRPYTPTRPVMSSLPASTTGERSRTASSRKQSARKQPASQHQPPTPPESPTDSSHSHSPPRPPHGERQEKSRQ